MTVPRVVIGKEFAYRLRDGRVTEDEKRALLSLVGEVLEDAVGECAPSSHMWFFGSDSPIVRDVNNELRESVDRVGKWRRERPVSLKGMALFRDTSMECGYGVVLTPAEADIPVGGYRFVLLFSEGSAKDFCSSETSLDVYFDHSNTNFQSDSMTTIYQKYDGYPCFL